MSGPACPNETDLLAFHLGDLAPAALDAVAAHVGVCPTCEALLAGYDARSTDPCLSALRRPRAAAAEPEADMPAPPGYELLGPLGAGGMGQVHKALQKGLNRHVALKRLRFADAKARARFKVEAEAVARLQHPNIVQVFEVGEVAGRPYLAMELVEGGSLDRAIGGQPMPATAAAALVRDLATAIAYAHARGIVHRDLKPANILLQRVEDRGSRIEQENSILDPRSSILAKVTDFGVAKRLDDDSLQTQAGAVLGTPAYMAPEQARGESDRVGPAADVYALGAILYECLTGRPPFLAPTTLETLRQVVENEPVPPTRLLPATPRDLETVCLKCLRKLPGERYLSAAALADDLGRFLAGRPISGRPTPLWERAWKAARRRPAEAALAVAVVASLLGGTAGSAFFAFRAVAARDESQRQRRATELALARSFLERGIAFCRQGDPAQGLPLMALALETNDAAAALERPGDDTGPRQQLDWAVRTNLAWWQFRHPVHVRAALRHTDWVWDVAFSPDGRLAATASSDRTARLWDARTGRPVGQPLRHAAAVWLVRFSPDGRTLLTATFDRDDESKGNAAHTWDVATGRPAGPAFPFVPVTAPGLTINAAYRPGTGEVLTQTAPKALTLFDPSSGRPVREFPLPADVVAAMFRPDGGQLAVGLADGTVRRLDPGTGGPAGEPLKLTGPVTALAYAPDGVRLLAGARDGSARVWDDRSGEPVGEPLAVGGRVMAAAFRPDGKVALTAAAIRPIVQGQVPTGEVRLWDVGTGRQHGPALTHPEPAWSAAFTGDGREVITACSDRRGRLWSAETGELLSQFFTPVFAGNARTVAVHPNGRTFLLANATENGAALLADAAEPQLLGAPLQHGPKIITLAVAPDGRLLTGCRDGSVRVWTPGETPRLDHEFQLPDGVAPRAFSPNGRLLVAGRMSSGTPLTEWRGGVWDMTTGQRHAAVPSKCAFHFAAFSPDGRTFATTAYPDRGAPTVAVWDAADVRRLVSMSSELPRGEYPLDVAFSPDGSRLVVPRVPDGVARLWDARNGRLLVTYDDFPVSPKQVAFHPDGRSVLIAQNDGGLRLWSAARPAPVGPPMATGGPVFGVGYHPGGRYAFVAGEGRVQLWQPATGLPLGPALEHQGNCWAAAFHPNGELLVGSDWSGHVKFWRLPPPLAGSPAAVRTWVEAITGRTTDNGGVLPLTPDALAERWQRLAEAGEPAWPRPVLSSTISASPQSAGEARR